MKTLSIESWGTQAEYIRSGLNLKLFDKDLAEIVDNGIDACIVCTFNLLSIPNFKEFLDVMLEFKTVAWLRGEGKVSLDTFPVDSHYQLSSLILDEKQLDNLRDLVYYMSKSVDDADVTKFNSIEFAKFERVLTWVEENRFTGDELVKNRLDFKKFVDEHDKERGTNFTKTFPELEYFYEMCNG